MKMIEVWVVEDDPLFRSTLTRVINKTNGLHCAGSYSNCEEAIASLEEDSPPQVVLMDIVLPGMDGIDGAARIRSLSPGTDVVILTNYADNDKIFRALCNGASGYLLKTSPATEIKTAILEVVSGGAPMNAQIARKVLDMFAGLAAPTENYGLTQREKEILKLVVDGESKKRIAELLFISFFTVDTHIKNIYAKLQVHSRSGAVTKVLKEHLV
jgi:DNA-binding NarL/FixJ family response regulator